MVIINLAQIMLHKNDYFSSVHYQSTVLISEALSDYRDTIGREQSADAILAQ